MRSAAPLVVLILSMFTVPGTVEAAASDTVELHVAAASDLRFALNDLVRLFERAHSVRVQITLGSSGQLAAQIEQGAPFDVFFSADETYVRMLADRGAVRRDSISLYALGRIVLWVQADAPFDPMRGFEMLTDPRVRYVAIANPQHAPYGAAAAQALKKAGVYDRLRSKLVFGENIAQTMQFVQTGNADAGIVALSLALAPGTPDRGRYWVIPSSFHEPIRQAVGVTTRSSRPAQVASFVSFVGSPAGRAVMRRYGFVLPGEGL